MARIHKRKAKSPLQRSAKANRTQDHDRRCESESGTDGPHTRFSMTFPVLRDLITAATANKPFAAPYGSVEAEWKAVTNKINEIHKLKPKMSWEVARSNINRVRKMHEEGVPPSALKLKLTNEEHTSIASGLDGLSKAFRDYEEMQAGISESKKQRVIKRAAAGARIREKAITRLSLRSHGDCGASDTSCTRTSAEPIVANSPTVAQETTLNMADKSQRARAASAPIPNITCPSTTSHRSITDLVLGITSAINLAEGYRSQRKETFQTELLTSVQELTKAEIRSAEALEGIFEVLKDIRDG
ncbi:unnamed protein product [Rhizoctonia solani]|uniref:Uncharacterized protein n=1 Tax=Rhizoctonia solani TaxID=456999 RepID=A0A8H3AAH4_9AGAM|nr:unnamed protein product [Rhizoctonia solani]